MKREEKEKTFFQFSFFIVSGASKIPSSPAKGAMSLLDSTPP